MERRPAQSIDAAAIILWFSTRTEATSWGCPQVPDPLTADWLAQQFQANRYWVWVDGNDQPQGVFGLVFPQEEQAHLTRFALRPDLRGQGMARYLVEEIIALARSLGAKRLSLGVYGSNIVAKRLYKALGFACVGERAAEEDISGVSHKMELNL